MLNEWKIEPGNGHARPSTMTDFNIFTFNARVWPGTDPWVVKKGERVRFSFGNLSMITIRSTCTATSFEEVRDRRRDRPEVGAPAETTVGRARRLDAHRRDGRERRGRLGIPLPQIPPHD